MLFKLANLSKALCIMIATNATTAVNYIVELKSKENFYEIISFLGK